MGVPIRLEGVRHEYARTDDSAPVQALGGVDLEIRAGEFLVLMGPSGSGKSTLLNLIGAVDRSTSGRVLLGDRDLTALSEGELTLIRRRSVGFVFQFFNLIPTFTARENIAFPLRLNGAAGESVTRRVDEVLEEVGLAPRADHYPNELSGGEMQRVAIGRAIVHRPELLLADEPTGNLDTRTGETILDLLASIHHTYAPTIVMATHSEAAAARGERIVEIVDGAIGSSRSRG